MSEPTKSEPKRVTCPCCHGEKRLTLFEPDMVTIAMALDCTHCMGRGEVPAGEESPHVNHHEIIVDPALQRHELTPQAKREQLRAAFKGMSDEEIERKIAELYK